MATVKTWLASAALLGGAGGGAAAAVAAPGGTDQSVTAAPPTVAAPDAGYLQHQIDSLLQEDRALKRAVSRARLRLAGQVRTGERSLAALNRRIVAAQNELARAQAARNRMSAAVVTVAPAPAPAAKPAAHATTGASGAGTRHGDDGGEHEGGDDD